MRIACTRTDRGLEATPKYEDHMTTPVLASAILLRRLMASLQALIAQGAAVVYHVWQDFLFFSLMKPFFPIFLYVEAMTKVQE